MPVKATGTQECFTLHFAKEVTVDVQKLGERKYRFTFEVEAEPQAADSAAGTANGTPVETTAAPAEETTSLPLPPEALAFCRRYHLLKHLETAYAIALKSFPTVCDVEFKVHEEEPGSEGIAIRLSVQGTVEEVLHWSNDCTAGLIESLPPEALGRICVTQGIVPNATH